MATFSEIKIIKEFDAEIRPKRNISFGSNFINVKRAVFLASALALLLLFLPFAKAGILAFIFSLAILEAKEKIRCLSKSRQNWLVALFGFFSLVFISLMISLGQSLYQLRDVIANGDSLAEIKSRINAILLPSINFLKETISELVVSVDGSKYVDLKIAESANHLIDSSFAWLLAWFLEIPNHFLQISFFIFMLIFLVRKMESRKTYNFLLNLEINKDTLQFLINAANHSGFNAVVATIFTAFAQAVVLTIGASLIGIKVWPLIFVTAFLSSMFPVFGILPVAAFCTLYAATLLNHTSALVMALFALVASVIDNILRPLFVSGEDSSINPILSFFALIGSLFLFGFAGLFIGPFVLIFTTMIFQKYIRA